MKIEISSIIQFIKEADFTYTHNWLTLRSLWHKFCTQNPVAQNPMLKAVETVLSSNSIVTSIRTAMWTA